MRSPICCGRAAFPSSGAAKTAPVPADVAFVLGDSLGEMGGYCAAADVAFVGGSLLPLGGQNLIEPIAMGTPTIVGPHTFNFREATDNAVAAGAALRVADADALVRGSGRAARGPRDAATRMRDAALAFHAAHRGAADRLWSWLAPRLRLSAQLPVSQPFRRRLRSARSCSSSVPTAAFRRSTASRYWK